MFRTTQRQAPDAVFSDYRNAALALEDFQIAQQRARFESAQRHFHLLVGLFGSVGFAAVVLGLFARFVLTASIVRPINSAIHHFERIAAGDLTSPVHALRANEMGRLMTALAHAALRY
ncbi:HAMP domain-containing protein [Paraburkholderia sp. SIMBA_030]|uniref:HAMP domain-containing protein n=1 Tax=Paraburkholderia sp. SIMBA_030 TaxID=3085773 RepID=UPI00397CF57F